MTRFLIGKRETELRSLFRHAPNLCKAGSTNHGSIGSGRQRGTYEGIGLCRVDSTLLCEEFESHPVVQRAGRVKGKRSNVLISKILHQPRAGIGVQSDLCSWAARRGPSAERAMFRGPRGGSDSKEPCPLPYQTEPPASHSPATGARAPEREPSKRSPKQANVGMARREHREMMRHDVFDIIRGQLGE